jgi:hypothetical protein
MPERVLRQAQRLDDAPAVPHGVLKDEISKL